MRVSFFELLWDRKSLPWDTSSFNFIAQLFSLRSSCQYFLLFFPPTALPKYTHFWATSFSHIILPKWGQKASPFLPEGKSIDDQTENEKEDRKKAHHCVCIAAQRNYPWIQLRRVAGGGAVGRRDAKNKKYSLQVEYVLVK